MFNKSDFSNGTLTNVPVWMTFNVELAIWYHAMICISTAGAISNFLIIITILSSKKLRSGCGMLIANLHILLFLQCAINMPILFAPIYQASFSGPPSGTFCRWSFFIYSIILNVVDWADMMIGLNRFIAICFPFSYPRWTTTRMIMAMVVFPWLPGSVIEMCFSFGIGGMFRSLPPWGGCGVVSFTPVMAQTKFAVSIAFPVASLGSYISVDRFTSTWRNKFD